MSRIIIKEIVYVLILILCISLFSYIILYYLPGSSEQIKQGLDYSGDTSETNQNFFHMLSSYAEWVKNILHGEFGYSEYTEESIISIIVPRWGITIFIALCSVLITLLLSICVCWLEVYLIYHFGKTHRLIKIYTIGEHISEKLLLSLLPITISIILLYLASWGGISFLDIPTRVRMIFPILGIVLLQLPLYIRSLKKSLLQVSGNAFIDFYHSLGYSYRWIWWREMLPNAFIFTLTLSIMQFSYLVGGIIIMEKIFLVPGLGSKLIESVMNRDRNVIQLIVVCTAIVIGITHSIFTIYKKAVYEKNA